MVRSWFRREDGQGLAEYAMILLLVALVIIAIVSAIGGRVGGMYSEVSDGIPPP